MDTKRDGNKFIYVNDSDIKDRLIESGFELLKHNPSQEYPLWIFLNNTELNIEDILNADSFILSDVVFF